MKRVLILETIVLAVLLFLFFSYKSTSGIKTRSININNQQITVEVADSDELRTQGLSGRTNLAQDHGMLFTFPTAGYYQFWMKEMKFPLDFIWIDKNIVVDISENIQAPKSKTETLTAFTAKKPFDSVLEVNAGIAKSLNIIIGDVIH